ncbi:MAG: hypothetical protein K8U03_17070 [Planctomycetia bacterium]|nr:hypothetical protein [Planctomycetia bacterium]
MSSIPDDELISAYLDDELSREERLRAEQLLLDRPDLRRLFEELRGLREGLKSLPKFSLGDEFVPAVLRNAERSVLRGEDGLRGVAAGVQPDEATKSVSNGPTPLPAPAAPAPIVERAVPIATAASIAAPFDRRRLLRPIVWSIAAVAAALALMFAEQRGFAPLDEKQLAMNQAPAKPQSPEIGNARDGTARDKGDAFSVKPALSKSGTGKVADAVTSADANGGFAASAPAVTSVPASASQAAVSQAAVSQATASQPTKMGATAGGMFSVFNGTVPHAAKAGDGTGGARTPTGPMDAVSQINVAPAPDSVEGIVRQDFERAQSLVSNYRMLQTERPDGRLDAGQLQRLGAVDRAGRGATTDLALTENDARQRKQALGHAQATTNSDNGLLIVRCDVTPEALDMAFTPVLRQQQIVDYTQNWGAESAKLQSDGLRSQADAKAKDESRGMESQTGENAAGLGLAAKNTTARRESGSEAKLAGDQPMVKGENAAAPAKTGDRFNDRESEEVEYVYVVANREQLESTLKTLRAEPNYFLNISVEPATAAAEETAKWQEYNRGGHLAEIAKQPATPLAKPAAITDGDSLSGTNARPTPAASTTLPKAAPLPPASAVAVPAGTAPTVAAAGISAPPGAVPSESKPIAAASLINAPTAAKVAGAPASRALAETNAANNELQQRRGYSLSRSQRFNGGQIAAKDSQSYASDKNPAGEKRNNDYGGYAAPVPSDVAKKENALGGGKGIAVNGATQAKSQTSEKERIDVAKLKEALPKEAPRLNAKTSATLPTGNVAGGSLPGASASQMLRTPSDAPEQVLGAIAGVQQPPPLMQQAEPTIEPNSIRGIAQAETELPADYREALFIFRVVKRSAGAPTEPPAAATPKPPIGK